MSTHTTADETISDDDASSIVSLDEEEDDEEGREEREMADLTELCSKHKVTRVACSPECDGWACRGCSGFARTHPELFGCCSNLVPCPRCYGQEVAAEWLERQKRQFPHIYQ